MNNELYAVAQLQRAHNDINDIEFFEEYDKAFDCLNEIIAEEGRQLKTTKAIRPIKVALTWGHVELWIIKRETQLTPLL